MKFINIITIFIANLILSNTLHGQENFFTYDHVPSKKIAIQEKKIVVVIPSFNNALYFENNIQSVLTQEYSNYHIIYIDDSSTDYTGALVEAYIKRYNLNHKITLIKNVYNRKALANIYKAVHMCDDNDIVLILDGDDALAHNTVLQQINHIFSTSDTWFAYANYKNLPEDKAKDIKIYAHPTPKDLITSRDFRGKWMWSGLRFFYAWLFKQIKLENLLLPHDPYRGKFFPTSYDGAIVYPMLEMSGFRIQFISDIWLLRNVDTPLNDFKIAKELQQLCSKVLKNSPKYDRLHYPTHSQTALKTPIADIVIFGNENNTALSIAHSIEKYIPDIGTIHICKQKGGKSYPEKISDKINFIEYEKNLIKKTLLKHAAGMSDYIIFTHSDIELRKYIDIFQCIKVLERTYSYGFYFGISLNSFGNNVPISKLPCEHILDNIYAWKFNCANPITINNFAMSLYRKKDILDQLSSSDAQTMQELEFYWNHRNIDVNKVGLFLDESPTIPLKKSL